MVGLQGDLGVLGSQADRCKSITSEQPSVWDFLCPAGLDGSFNLVDLPTELLVRIALSGDNLDSGMRYTDIERLGQTCRLMRRVVLENNLISKTLLNGALNAPLCLRRGRSRPKMINN